MKKKEFIEKYINNINNGTMRDSYGLSSQVNENMNLYELATRVVCLFCPLDKECAELFEHRKNIGCDGVLKNNIEDFKEVEE